MLLGFPVWRVGVRFRQRGFTLVELAIALAVVGLLLGASLIPLRALDEARQLQDERRRMETIRDAIVGYAQRHRTRARTVRYVDRRPPHPFWEFRLPGGRPYLPCPDWDGDGFEDRAPQGSGGFVQGMEVKPDLTVTATIVGRFGDNISNGPYPYYIPGECRASRGNIPWRTLGVSPADNWGNRHTYFADPAFSNALIGFDRKTVADLYDRRLPTAPQLGLPLRRIDAWVDERNRTGFVDDEPNGCPAVICNGLKSSDCGIRPPPGSNATPGYADDCIWEPRLPMTLVLEGGEMARTHIAGNRPILPEVFTRGWPFVRGFPPGTVTDGIPIAVVSHGPNGRFAVSHWASLGRPVDSRGVKSPVCDLPGTLPFFPGDREYRRLYFSEPQRRPVLHEAINATRNSPGRESCGQLDYSHSLFVWEPPGTGDKSDFDDMLLWVTREELSGAMRGEIPPLPRMVVGYSLCLSGLPGYYGCAP